MTVKIVYYGPGLCGKTTNLQLIYQRTSPDTRGEMVSLETEADRTLFFDLLPIEVGRIGGYKTRLQLYTVPGQVFYNTTRKVVLKGVDGMVFVADSQREMLDANLESFYNLRENMDELGVNLDDIPLVIQYNKRDLPNALPVEELNKHINKRGYPFHESVAVRGDGVFETLKEISKQTLKALRKRLTEGTRPPTPPRPPLPPRATIQQQVAPSPDPEVDETPKKATPVDSVPTSEMERPTPPSIPRKPQSQPEKPSESEDYVEFDTSEKKDEEAVEVRHVKVKHSLDVLAELEKFKSAPVVKKKRSKLSSSAALEDLLISSANHKKGIQKNFDIQVNQSDLAKVKKIKLTLQLEDEREVVITRLSDLDILLQGTENIAQLCLDLKVKLEGK